MRNTRCRCSHDVPAADLAMLTCVGGCGLGMTMTNVPVDVASDVVVFGAGPVGPFGGAGRQAQGCNTDHRR